MAAAGLAADHGIGAGDVITWQLPTWLESMVLVGAISRLGATQNPVLPIYREREVGFCARQAGAKLLVVPSDFAGFDYVAMAEKIAGEWRRRGRGVMTLGPLAARPAIPATLPPPPASGDDVRWLFYTSGTTADPKGAQHTDRTIYAVAKGMGERLGVTAADRNALAFPFTHIGGITWLFTSLQSGMSNILFQAFIPDVVVKVLSERGVTMAGSGTYFHQTYLAAQKAADQPIFPEVAQLPRRRRAQAGRALLGDEGRCSARRSCRATASPRRRSSPWARATTSTTTWPRPRARPCPASSSSW